MNNDKQPEREIKWKEYTLRVEHCKYYLTLALQVNAFFYLTTGAVFGYYLNNPSQYSLFFLLLPILIGSVFGGIFIYGSKLQRKASISIEKLRNELAGSKFALKTEEFFDVRTIHLLFMIFGCIFLLVVTALILLPCLTRLPINSKPPENLSIFVPLAVVILLAGTGLPWIANRWVKNLFNDLGEIISTERLFLRHISDDDAEFVLELVKENSSWIQNIGGKDVGTIDDARRYISNSLVASYEQFGFGLYLVGLKKSGVSVGICGLVKRGSLKDTDISFGFLKKFWFEGYAFESASGVMNYARKDLGLKRVVAIVSPAVVAIVSPAVVVIVSPDDKRSIKVVEKIGLRFEKMIKLPEDKEEIMQFAPDLDFIHFEN
jgi:RimJ/RimL family protein N-acetyltransferase